MELCTRGLARGTLRSRAPTSFPAARRILCRCIFSKQPTLSFTIDPTGEKCHQQFIVGFPLVAQPENLEDDSLAPTWHRSAVDWVPAAGIDGPLLAEIDVSRFSEAQIDFEAQSMDQQTRLATLRALEMEKGRLEMTQQEIEVRYQEISKERQRAATRMPANSGRKASTGSWRWKQPRS